MHNRERAKAYRFVTFARFGSPLGPCGACQNKSASLCFYVMSSFFDEQSNKSITRASSPARRFATFDSSRTRSLSTHLRFRSTFILPPFSTSPRTLSA